MGDSPCLPGILHLLDTPSEQQTAASLINTLAKSELEVFSHVNNNRRPLILLHANWTKPTLTAYPRNVCLSPMMLRDGGAKPSTKRRKSWPGLSCHEKLARKRLATGRTIHFTSWLTLVKLESSSFRESHVKSDQSVVNGKQILAKKRKPTKLPDHQYSFNHLMFCEVRGFTITLEVFGEIMNYESPFQWSLPITRSAAV